MDGLDAAGASGGGRNGRLERAAALCDEMTECFGFTHYGVLVNHLASYAYWVRRAWPQGLQMGLLCAVGADCRC